MVSRIDRARLLALGTTLVGATCLLVGCAGQGGGSAAAGPAASSPAAAPASGSAGAERVVKSRDGRFDGIVVGAPSANSKFAKVQIGMEMQEVQQLIGAPDLWHTHETGKRWIPFYFGNDTRRLQATWRGEGCLSFTGGNVWGGGGNELIRIEVDPSGKCYQP